MEEPSGHKRQSLTDMSHQVVNRSLVAEIVTPP